MMKHQLPAAKLKQRSAALSEKLPLDVFCKLGSAGAKGKGWRSWETQSDLLTQAFLAQMLRLRAGLWMAWLLRSYQLDVFLFWFLLIFVFAAMYSNAVCFLKDILQMFVGEERAFGGIVSLLYGEHFHRPRQCQKGGWGSCWDKSELIGTGV